MNQKPKHPTTVNQAKQKASLARTRARQAFELVPPRHAARRNLSQAIAQLDHAVLLLHRKIENEQNS